MCELIVTSAGWQVTLCDPMWYVSSRSGEAGYLRTAISVYFTLIYRLLVAPVNSAQMTGPGLKLLLPLLL